MFFTQLKHLLHPIIHACISWLQRKNCLICKGHVSYTCDFITEYQGRRDPTRKIGMQVIVCMHAVWL